MLLNPHEYDPAHFDAETRRLLRATIDWFEQRGKAKLAEDYHAPRPLTGLRRAGQPFSGYGDQGALAPTCTYDDFR